MRVKIVPSFQSNELEVKINNMKRMNYENGRRDKNDRRPTSMHKLMCNTTNIKQLGAETKRKKNIYKLWTNKQSESKEITCCVPSHREKLPILTFKRMNMLLWMLLST